MYDRIKLRDVRSREDFEAWTEESPWANHPIKNVKVILFTPGQGWLRFRGVHEMLPSYSYEEPPEPIYLMPPAHMVWSWAWCRIEWALRGGGNIIVTFVRYDDPDKKLVRQRDRIRYENWVAKWSDLRRDCVDPDWPEAFLYF